MAKIAGRKNDGAWFRMNQFLLKSQASVRTNFASQLAASDEFPAAFNAIQGYILEVGVGQGTFPSTAQQWAASLSLGIPRQIWEGVTTYDHYTRSGDTPIVYYKQMQPVIFKLSVFIRELSKQIRFGSEEVGWLSELTRPAKGQAAAVPVLMIEPEARAAEVVRIVRHLTSEEGVAEVERIRAYRAKRRAEKSLTGTGDGSISPVLQPRQLQSRRRRPEAASAPA